MTPAEFKAARKALGLTITALASEFRTNERTIRRWEHGDIQIPGTAVLAMKYLAGITGIRFNGLTRTPKKGTFGYSQ